MCHCEGAQRLRQSSDAPRLPQSLRSLAMTHQTFTRNYYRHHIMNNELRIGIIGFDTSHVPAFAKLLNDHSDPHHVAGARVTLGVPTFSPDLESSYSRVEGYKQEVTEKYGVELLDSIDEMVEGVDAVLLESVDGRRHLAEARPVIAARKPLFVDKPFAANYADAAELMRLAKENDCPIFSSSSLRYDANILEIKNDEELGRVFSCDAFSPANLDPTNPGFFWYGIHGVEILYTFMGAGCRSVRAIHTDESDILVGAWPDGRLGTVRGTRGGSGGYGATIFGEKKIAQTQYSTEVPLYSQLLKQIVPFFNGAPSPIASEETLEMMAFIQAGIVSQDENREVELSEITA